jgi:hypothetical protein
MGSKSLRRVCGMSACKKDGACCCEPDKSCSSDNDPTCCRIPSWCSSRSGETRPGRRLSRSNVDANPKTAGSNDTPLPSLSSVLTSAEPSSDPSACYSNDDCPGSFCPSPRALVRSSAAGSSFVGLSVILRLQLKCVESYKAEPARASWCSGESV